MEANLKGHDSHGAIRIENYVRDVRSGAIQPGVVTEVESETETTAVLNGHWNYGQVVGRDTMNAAIDKARAHGVGIVTATAARTPAAWAPTANRRRGPA